MKKQRITQTIGDLYVLHYKLNLIFIFVEENIISGEFHSEEREESTDPVVDNVQDSGIVE